VTIDLPAAWKEIEQGHPSGEGWIARTLIHDPLTLRAAVAFPGCMPALIIEVEARSIPKNVELPTCRGFNVQALPMVAGARGKVRLCLELADTKFADLFTALAMDVATSISGAIDEGSGVRTFIDRLHMWQAFMQHHFDGLTVEQQTGLFGELLVLKRLLQEPRATRGRVDAWKGPMAALRDFEFGSSHMEVKTAVGAGADRFHVSHLGQMDESTVENLLLCHCALVEGTEGANLTDLVSSIRELLASNISALVLFNDRLLLTGYSHVHSMLYEGRRLLLQSMRFFRVEGAFPRLKPNETRSGILDATYVVDLRACAPFEIDSPTALNLILDSERPQ
jgi:hypothetical protein